jgi:UDP:flavonoid glycosyltransferase YjiC (YdhE family)
VKNLLFISGSVGLGHVTRDLAVVRALRALRKDVAVSWLAAHPATLVLEQAGESLLPECAQYANESTQAEAASSGYGLNLISYLMRARRAWERNVKLFERLTHSGRFDAVVGDETYELNVAQMKDAVINPLPYFCLYDFIGMDAASRHPLDRLMTYAWNWIWARDGRLYGRDKNKALFVGEQQDVADRPFDWLLPNRRQYALRYYHFVGYILSFDPAQLADRRAVRARLGYGKEPLVVCSVGGTAVGRDLLQLCAQAYPALRALVPDVRMVLVAGPRIAIDSLSVPAGVEVKGYVPALHEHFAASDLCVVQGGGTTTLELTALRRPFLYFPLEGHFEQEVAVAERLARHRAGERMRFSQTSPEALAARIAASIGQPVAYADVKTDGARVAAAMISAAL